MPRTLFQTALDAADRIAIVDASGKSTYGEVLSAAMAVRDGLVRGPARGGDDLDESRVAFLVPGGLDYVATLLGIWAAGGIAVPLGLQHPDPLPDELRPKWLRELALGANPQGAEENVDDPMDVMHRQDVQDAVVATPFPRIDESVDLSGDVPVRHDNPLRPSGAGVPTIYSRLIAACDEASPRTRQRWLEAARGMRLHVSGSAALPVPALRRWESMTAQWLLERWLARS